MDFVAQYEAIVSEHLYPVVRYDGSHGRGHRNWLDRHGETIRKDWFAEELTLADVLTLGIRDIVANWRTYREELLDREGLAGSSE